MPQNREVGRLRSCVVIVLAATARIGPHTAVSIRWKDFRDDAVEVRGAPRGPTYRPVFLPIARELIARYRAALPASHIDSEFLLVSRSGRKMQATDINRSFRSLARHLGIPGSQFVSRLLDYFDRQFDAADDRAAVAALAGRRLAPDEVGSLPAREIERAREDRGRLAAVLKAHHALAGPPGRFLGPRGLRLAAKTQKLARAKRLPMQRSVAVRRDSVCRLLTEERWDQHQGRQRRRLKALYFDTLDDMRITGELAYADIAYLFHVRLRTAKAWAWRRRRSRRTEAQAARELQWRAALPALYRARPPHERLLGFQARIAAEHPDCPFLGAQIKGVLLVAGALGGRPH
ncbi:MULTISPECIES: hypothetical protein [Bradyrhizobium]|uniref:hypothetical protein n=1 Tax=Bradyrhizobium TaxID=374 RepID=UPI001141F227|nr:MULTISPECIES: hypothetical protein [Bradyrhizobium]UFW46281.1 hypothetical protein BaraCB756_28680 [Bradyrhizobium arachidis]